MRWFLVLAFILSVSIEAAFNVGGYVPFGPSTQRDTEGGTNAFAFDPMIGVNALIPIPGLNHVFLPEFDIVLNGSGADGYSKNTLLFLVDVGYIINPKFIFRYGVGTVMTIISGDGETLQLPNGDGTSDYYQPSESATSWNTTLNFGVEYGIDQNYSVRFQTYLFSFLSSTSRKLSYSLSLSYYL